MYKLTIYHLILAKNVNCRWSILYQYNFTNVWKLQTQLQTFLNAYPGHLRYNIIPCYGLSYHEQYKTTYNDGMAKINTGGDDNWPIHNKENYFYCEYYRDYKHKKKRITIKHKKEYMLYAN